MARDELNRPETFYPLRAYVCDACWLVQVHEHVGGEDIFSHYAYFSSFSDSWLKHAADYVEMITVRLGLGPQSHVVEVASNDGYLLKNFVARRDTVPGNRTGRQCGRGGHRSKEFPARVEFFGTRCATQCVREGLRADLLIGNNVLAHVPDLNDFVGGLKVLLAPGGTITIEFPHVLNLIELNQFDTIYQEHYCYHSVLTLDRVFAQHGLSLFDVEQLPTHGGSLRIYVGHQGDTHQPVTEAVRETVAREVARGLTDLATFQAFARRVEQTKWNLLEFSDFRPSPGETRLRLRGAWQGQHPLKLLRHSRGPAAVHRGPQPLQAKQFSRRVTDPGILAGHDRPHAAGLRPDPAVESQDEIMQQMKPIREWGGKFVIPIPELQVL